MLLQHELNLYLEQVLRHAEKLVARPLEEGERAGVQELARYVLASHYSSVQSTFACSAPADTFDRLLAICRRALGLLLKTSITNYRRELDMPRRWLQLREACQDGRRWSRPIGSSEGASSGRQGGDRVYLVVQLTHSYCPQDLSHYQFEQFRSYLAVQDAFCTFPCVLASSNPSYVGEWLLLLQWSFVTSSPHDHVPFVRSASCGYLEVRRYVLLSFWSFGHGLQHRRSPGSAARVLETVEFSLGVDEELDREPAASVRGGRLGEGEARESGAEGRKEELDARDSDNNNVDCDTGGGGIEGRGPVRAGAGVGDKDDSLVSRDGFCGFSSSSFDRLWVAVLPRGKCVQCVVARVRAVSPLVCLKENSLEESTACASGSYAVFVELGSISDAGRRRTLVLGQHAEVRVGRPPRCRHQQGGAFFLSLGRAYLFYALRPCVVVGREGWSARGFSSTWDTAMVPLSEEDALSTERRELERARNAASPREKRRGPSVEGGSEEEARDAGRGGEGTTSAGSGADGGPRYSAKSVIELTYNTKHRNEDVRCFSVYGRSSVDGGGGSFRGSAVREGEMVESYSGEVTGDFDGYSFELDGRYRVYVYRWRLCELGMGLRVGARVSLRHAHALYQRDTHVGFGLCVRSRYSIDLFADAASETFPLCKVSTSSAWSRLPVPMFRWAESMAERLSTALNATKFSRSRWTPEVLSSLAARFEISTPECRGCGVEWFWHDSDSFRCPTSVQPFPELYWPKWLKNWRLTRSNQILYSRLRLWTDFAQGFSCLDRKDADVQWRFLVDCYRDLELHKANYVLIGTLRLSHVRENPGDREQFDPGTTSSHLSPFAPSWLQGPRGCLHFFDGTSTLPILLLGALEPSHLFRVFKLERFWIFQESVDKKVLSRERSPKLSDPEAGAQQGRRESYLNYFQPFYLVGFASDMCFLDEGECPSGGRRVGLHEKRRRARLSVQEKPAMVADDWNHANYDKDANLRVHARAREARDSKEEESSSMVDFAPGQTALIGMIREGETYEADQIVKLEDHHYLVDEYTRLARIQSESEGDKEELTEKTWSILPPSAANIYGVLLFRYSDLRSGVPKHMTECPRPSHQAPCLVLVISNVHLTSFVRVFIPMKLSSCCLGLIPGMEVSIKHIETRTSNFNADVYLLATPKTQITPVRFSPILKSYISSNHPHAHPCTDLILSDSFRCSVPTTTLLSLSQSGIHFPIFKIRALVQKICHLSIHLSASPDSPSPAPPNRHPPLASVCLVVALTDSTLVARAKLQQDAAWLLLLSISVHQSTLLSIVSQLGNRQLSYCEYSGLRVQHLPLDYYKSDPSFSHWPWDLLSSVQSKLSSPIYEKYHLLAYTKYALKARSPHIFPYILHILSIARLSRLSDAYLLLSTLVE